jgi:hypothetical protein
VVTCFDGCNAVEVGWAAMVLLSDHHAQAQATLFSRSDVHRRAMTGRIAIAGFLKTPERRLASSPGLSKSTIME